MTDDTATDGSAAGEGTERDMLDEPPEVVRGRRWRRRWDAMNEDERELIVDTVDAGEACTDPARAALAVTYASRSLRDVVGAVLLGPALTVLAIAIGFAAGRLTRGDSGVQAFIDIITWRSGVPWLVAAVVLTALAYLAARRRVRRLRESREANRTRLRA